MKEDNLKNRKLSHLYKLVHFGLSTSIQYRDMKQTTLHMIFSKVSTLVYMISSDLVN